MNRLPIVDTHVHFWDMRTPGLDMAWVWLDKDVDHPIIGDIDAIKMVKFDIHSVWAEARFADVSGFVHIQAAIGSADPVTETQWLTRMRETAPVPFTIIAHADLGTEQGLRQLERHAESPYFAGIRDFMSESYLESGEINELFEVSLRDLTRRGLVFDLDCGWPNMAAGADLARRHPELPIVLEHLGFPRARDDEYFQNWRAGLRKLAEPGTVTCKISGVAMTDPLFTQESIRRWVETCVEVFGPDRCVLGSNWPVDRLYSGYERIMDYYRDFISTLTESEQGKILSQNATRLYGL